MEKERRKRVLELRDRMDRTLALPDLADQASLRALVKKHILDSALPGSDHQGDVDLIADTRTREVSEFLEMLNTSSDGRKVHGAPHKEWKVKQDTDQLRVMYREGPEGTPFHTLLAEGFADGPIDVCTCVSWEAGLYKKWFPQYNLPTFRVDQSGCLKKVRIGEEISLVRVKVPWPVSEREALLHFFELEYLKEDLVIVIMKTISDLDSISTRTHGFTRDGIPEAGDTVRIDVFGGFVLQRITKDKSFFRAIANMDIKLDFVPPWLINFISRQLIGSGHKLYQKAVSTVASCDEDYKKALRAPLYVRIREYENLDNKVKTDPAAENDTNEILPENPTVHNLLAVTNTASNCEIVEEENEQSTLFAKGTYDNLVTALGTQPAAEQHVPLGESRPLTISPEVERALGILDTAIAVVRGQKADNIVRLQNLLGVSEGNSTVGSRSSHANLLISSDHLPSVSAPPAQGSREEVLPQADALHGVEEDDDANDGASVENSRASTATTTKMVPTTTLRGMASRVHGEESLSSLVHRTDSKESRRNRRRRRKWLCCLPV